MSDAQGLVKLGLGGDRAAAGVRGGERPQRPPHPLARPHLADPYWTLHAAIELGDTQAEWPLPYQPGHEQAMRLAQRAQEAIRA